MPQVKVYVYKPETNLRRGGSIQGPDNVIDVLKEPDRYVALEQCAGGAVVEGPDRNFWWVRIEVPRENGDVVTGWVSAVRIQGGRNDEPIRDVPPSPTVFEAGIGSAPAAPGG